MHILFIPSWYPLTPDDLNGCFFREQAIALTRYGLQVGVLSFHGHLRKHIKQIEFWGGVSQLEIDSSVQTWRVHHVSGIRGYGRFILPLIVSRFFKEYYRFHGPPDIIHAQSALNGGIIAMDLARQNKIPYVVTEHSTAFPRKLLPTSSLAKAKKVFMNAASILAVSSPLANCIKKSCNISRNIQIVPNLLCEHIFSNVMVNCKESGEPFIFLNVGMLSQKKGQNILIEAFTRSFRDMPVKLYIGGEGEAFEELKQLIAEKDMGKQICLLGKLSRDQVRQQMMKCNAFVLSSLFETFGVVIIEAFACGKPVVATVCGGPEDIVTPKNGILVEKNSIEALSVGMQNIYYNIDKYDSVEIRNDCIKKFGEKAVVSTLTQIYQSVLSI